MTRSVRLPLQVRLFAVVLASWGLADLFEVRIANDSWAYVLATSVLLAIGLFGSTVSIDLAEAAAHKRIIVLAITLGVIVKALLIGGVLYLFSRDPAFLVVGVAVAQIDPLSVAALIRDQRLSPRVKTILTSWASFDDPMTVLLVVYASSLTFGPIGGSGTPHPDQALTGLTAYGLDFAANVAFAIAAYAVWRFLRRRPAWLVPLLVVLFALAVWQFLMLGLAIAGLFVRPPGLAKVMERVTRGALMISGVVLGLLLVNGIDAYAGLAVGLLAFASQMVAGSALTKGLSRTDRLHLALAQQNGITAIILALRLEVQFPRAVAIIAPAILTTNVVHFLANALVDRAMAGRGSASVSEPEKEPTDIHSPGPPSTG